MKVIGATENGMDGGGSLTVMASTSRAFLKTTYNSQDSERSSMRMMSWLTLFMIMESIT